MTDVNTINDANQKRYDAEVQPLVDAGKFVVYRYEGLWLTEVRPFEGLDNAVAFFNDAHSKRSLDMHYHLARPDAEKKRVPQIYVPGVRLVEGLNE